MIPLLLLIFIIFILIFLRIKTVSNNILTNNHLGISIIVAAKNESANIKLLVESVYKQKYDYSKFELILVDDNSSDDTLNIMSTLANNYSNLIVIQANKKQFSGKRGALQLGIERANFPNIVITDADCEPSSSFLMAYSNKFNENYDFIFGASPMRQTDTFTNKIASYDNLWVHILTFSFANIGFPYSASARSFGFKKDSFFEIEGYENTTDTLSGDDDLLLREAVKKRMKITTIINPEAFVYTSSKQTFNAYLNQKARHTSSSNYYLITTKSILGLWHLLNLIMLLSIVLIPYSPSYVLLFFTKILGDIYIVRHLMNRFGYLFTFIELIYLQLIYDLLLPIIFIKGFYSKNKW
jgi:glycosyltransferase involved in cell wall biosynthesis